MVKLSCWHVVDCISHYPLCRCNDGFDREGFPVGDEVVGFEDFAANVIYLSPLIRQTARRRKKARHEIRLCLTGELTSLPALEIGS